MHHAERENNPGAGSRNRRQGTLACPAPTQTAAAGKPPQLLRERRPPQAVAPPHHPRRGHRKRGAAGKDFKRSRGLRLCGKSVCSARGQEFAHVRCQRPQRRRAERKGIIYRAIPFSCDTDQAQRRAVGCGVCRLPFRRKAAQRVLRRGQRLHSQGRRGLFSNPAAAPCPAGICRPGNPLERRREGRVREESPACIQF